MTASPRKNTVHKKYNPPTRRSKRYRPVKSSELVGIDAIELRMGELRCYVITMIDEHSNYALAQAVPSLNCDIIKLYSLSISTRASQITGKSSQETSTKHRRNPLASPMDLPLYA